MLVYYILYNIYNVHNIIYNIYITYITYIFIFNIYIYKRYRNSLFKIKLHLTVNSANNSKIVKLNQKKL